VRRAEGLSSGLWIPTLWMLYSGSRPVALWFPAAMPGGGDITAGSPLDQCVLGMLILLPLIILVKRQISWSNVLKGNTWLFVLFLYMGISALWSDYTMVSFKRWVRVVGAVFPAVLVMSEIEPWRSLETIIRRTAYVLIPFSIVLIKYFPALGIEYGRWSGSRQPLGVCMQKNGLGLLCTVVAFFLIWDLLRKRRSKPLTYNKSQTRADILILMMTFYLLIGADTDVYSATAIGVLVIGICAMFALSKLRASPEYITPFVVVVAIVGVIALISAETILGESLMGSWANFLGREETLTGRVDIWAEAFKIAPRWSVLGTGFGAFWGLPYTISAIGQTTGHNGYLEVYIELGFVGMFLISVFLLKLWGSLSIEVKHNFDWGLLGICLLLMSIAYNYAESNFLNVNSLLWIVLLYMTFVLSRAAKAKPTIRADSLRCGEECGGDKKGWKR